MKTNITFLCWALGRPWIVSSTPCTRTGTANSNSRAEESIYTSKDGEWKREEGGDVDEHDILLLGGGQDLNSQQHSLHTHRYSIQKQQGRSEIREEEDVPKRKEESGNGGKGGGRRNKERGEEKGMKPNKDKNTREKKEKKGRY
jgi:hypothetical protein